MLKQRAQPLLQTQAPTHRPTPKRRTRQPSHCGPRTSSLRSAARQTQRRAWAGSCDSLPAAAFLPGVGLLTGGLLTGGLFTDWRFADWRFADWRFADVFVARSLLVVDMLVVRGAWRVAHGGSSTREAPGSADGRERTLDGSACGAGRERPSPKPDCQCIVPPVEQPHPSQLDDALLLGNCCPCLYLCCCWLWWWCMVVVLFFGGSWNACKN